MRCAFALLVLLLLSGCLPARPPVTVPSQDELGRRVAEVAVESWRAAGLDVTPAVSVILRLRVVRAADPAEHERQCPVQVVGHSAACLGWAEQGEIPIAYVADYLTSVVQLERAGLHEVCHAMEYRFGRRPDYDENHTDAQVFAGPGGSRPDSVEQRAQRVLDAQRDIVPAR